MKRGAHRRSVVLVVALLASAAAVHAAGWTPVPAHPVEWSEPVIQRYWKAVWGAPFVHGVSGQLLDFDVEDPLLVETWFEAPVGGSGAVARYTELQRGPATDPTLTPQQIAQGKWRRFEEFDVVAEVIGPTGEPVLVSGVITEIEPENDPGKVTVVFTPTDLLDGGRRPAPEQETSLTSPVDPEGAGDSVRSPCTDFCLERRQQCQDDVLDELQRQTETLTAALIALEEYFQQLAFFAEAFGRSTVINSVKADLEAARKRADRDLRWCDVLYDLCIWLCG